MYKLTFLPNSEYRHTIFSMQISSSFSTIDTDIEIDWHTLPSTPTLLRLVSPPSACLLPSRIQIAHEGHLLWIPFFLWKKKNEKKISIKTLKTQLAVDAHHRHLGYWINKMLPKDRCIKYILLNLAWELILIFDPFIKIFLRYVRVKNSIIYYGSNYYL